MEQCEGCAHENPGAQPFTRVQGTTAYGIPVAFLEVRGLDLQARAPRDGAAALQAAMEAYLRSLLTTREPEAILAHPRLAGYRALHAAIGKTGRAFVPAPESFLRLLLKRRTWQPRGRLVDCYNLVALQTLTSIGAHDLARLTLPVSLATLRGGETVQVLGEDAPLILTAGEYAYRDAAGRLLGRLECRQAVHSCVTDTTRDVLFIVQGHATLHADALLATVDALCGAVRRYCGAWDSHARQLAT